MTDPTRDEGTGLTVYEQGLVASLVRQDLRRTLRKAISLHAKTGPAWDATKTRERIDLLCSVYRALGYEPERITNLPDLHDLPDKPRHAVERALSPLQGTEG
jgi:hypothetical protein